MYNLIAEDFLMSEKENYKQQTKLSFLQFLAETPNFVVVTISALLTGSMIVWMDFIDSLGHYIRTCAVLLLSRYMIKDLRYKYNYGLSKLEDITVLLGDSIVMCGLVIAVIMSVFELRDPSQPSGLLIIVVGWKAITVIVDAFFLWGQYKIRKTDNSVFARSNFMAWVASVLFDSANLCSVLLVWLLNDIPWTWYFSPIISILISIYLGYQCIGRLRKAISELTDKTLSEEDQMKILKVITRHDKEYSEFHSVKSHKLGNKAHIDLVISFSAETTYKEISMLKDALQSEIAELIEDSTVSITVQ